MQTQNLRDILVHAKVPYLWQATALAQTGPFDSDTTLVLVTFSTFYKSVSGPLDQFVYKGPFHFGSPS